jgi:glutamate synthase (NADPH/NADH) small chain
VVLFEKNDRIGGLLRYGIPDFKMEKWLIDRRLEQMGEEGVEFRTGVCVGIPDSALPGVNNWAAEFISGKAVLDEFDAVVLSGGAEHPRDLPIPGRDLQGIHFAMEFLPLQNKRVAGDAQVPDLWATGKHVVVIGGGDTGSDCVGTSNRHGAKSVTQFELLPQPPQIDQGNPVWPYWPAKLRTSSSHEEGANRDWAVSTKHFKGENGKVTALVACRVEWKKDPASGQTKMQEVPGSEFELPADLVLLAMGFLSPVHKGLLDELGVAYEGRGNVKATTDGASSYQTSLPKVFAAGDMRRGQSLVVWAIREGRQCARAVDEFLMGSSELPR